MMEIIGKCYFQEIVSGILYREVSSRVWGYRDRI